MNTGLRGPRATEPENEVNTLAKPNYGYEKRQKELAKQKKKAEKAQKKLEKAHMPADDGQEQSNEDTDTPVEDKESS